MADFVCNAKNVIIQTAVWERDFIEMSENMELTHFDEHGNAVMVDVSEKKITSRTSSGKR